MQLFGLFFFFLGVAPFNDANKYVAARRLVSHWSALQTRPLSVVFPVDLFRFEFTWAILMILENQTDFSIVKISKYFLVYHFLKHLNHSNSQFYFSLIKQRKNGCQSIWFVFFFVLWKYKITKPHRQHPSTIFFHSEHPFKAIINMPMIKYDTWSMSTDNKE